MRSSFEAAWVVRSGRGERECRASFEVNRGFSQFRTGGQSGGKTRGVTWPPGPHAFLGGASGGVERAIWGAARGDAGGFSAGRGLGRLVRGSDRAIESARGFATDTAARPALRPTPAPIASFHTATAPRPARARIGKKTCEGERAVRGARAAFEARRRSGGSPAGWDRMHSRPRRRPRGDPARSITPNPAPTPPGGAGSPLPHELTRKPRKVNREKESRVEAVDPTRRRRRAWLIHGHRCGLCAPQRARIRS